MPFLGVATCRGRAFQRSLLSLTDRDHVRRRLLITPEQPPSAVTRMMVPCRAELMRLLSRFSRGGGFGARGPGPVVSMMQLTAGPAGQGKPQAGTCCLFLRIVRRVAARETT